MDVRKERSVQLLASCRHIQGALPLLFGDYFCIAWGSYETGANQVLAFEKGYTPSGLMNANEIVEVIWLTLRPLGKTHAQPAHAALAADAGGPGAKGVERDGSDDQRQVQGQVYCPGYVHIHLPYGQGRGLYDMQFIPNVSKFKFSAGCSK